MLRGLRGREARRSKSFASVTLRTSKEILRAGDAIDEAAQTVATSNIRRTKRRSGSAGERGKDRTASWGKQLDQSKEHMGELLQAAIQKLVELDRPEKSGEEDDEDDEMASAPSASPWAVPGSAHTEVFDWLALRLSENLQEHSEADQKNSKDTVSALNATHQMKSAPHPPKDAAPLPHRRALATYAVATYAIAALTDPRNSILACDVHVAGSRTSAPPPTAA